MAGFFTDRKDTVYSGELGRHAPQKGTPAVIEREDKRKSKKKQGDECRDAVWKRDRGICRATGVRLGHSGSDSHTVGEVDHTLLRSDEPSKIFDPTNCVLISKYLNRLRKVRCRDAGQYLRFDHEPVTPGDTDSGNARRFIWRDEAGNIERETISDKDGQIRKVRPA
jgi:hypothetical protein